MKLNVFTKYKQKKREKKNKSYETCRVQMMIMFGFRKI